MRTVPETSPTFCVYPWMEFIFGPAPRFRLCCISKSEDLKDEDEKAYYFTEDSPKDCWNSYVLRQIRKKNVGWKKNQSL